MVVCKERNLPFRSKKENMSETEREWIHIHNVYMSLIAYPKLGPIPEQGFQKNLKSTWCFPAMTFLFVLCLISFFSYPNLSILQHPISVLFHILQHLSCAKTVFSQTDRPPSAARKKPKTEQKNPIIHQKDHIKHIEQAGEKKNPAKQFSLSLWQLWRAGARLDIAAKPAAISSHSDVNGNILVKPEWNYRETSEA